MPFLQLRSKSLKAGPTRISTALGSQASESWLPLSLESWKCTGALSYYRLHWSLNSGTFARRFLLSTQQIERIHVLPRILAKSPESLLKAFDCKRVRWHGSIAALCTLDRSRHFPEVNLSSSMKGLGVKHMDWIQTWQTLGPWKHKSKLSTNL